jgi:hypothetical protein
VRANSKLIRKNTAPATPMDQMQLLLLCQLQLADLAVSKGVVVVGGGEARLAGAEGWEAGSIGLCYGA